MRLLIVCLLLSLVSCATLPQKGTVQCSLGLQMIGCEFSELAAGPVAGTLAAKCDAPRGRLVFPSGNCVLINPRD